jgi:hypothetical protein
MQTEKQIHKVVTIEGQSSSCVENHGKFIKIWAEALRKKIKI